MSKFAIFILTHGRPDSQLTLNLLERVGYSGDIYLVLDDQDKTIQKYIDNYGPEKIVVFDKNEFVVRTDTGNSNPVFGCGVYARNAIEHIAKELGYKVFAQADDDILNFRIRYPRDNKIRSHCIDNVFNDIINEYIEFIQNEHIAYVGFGNAPTYMGGIESFNLNNQNFPYAFMIRNGNIDVDWKMNFSDDYATPISLNTVGNLCIQVPFVQIDESPVAKVTDKNSGGMVDSYRNQTDVSLAFYMKMLNPNSVSITLTDVGVKLARHGRKLRPKIISGRYKK